MIVIVYIFVKKNSYKKNKIIVILFLCNIQKISTNHKDD